MTKSAVITPKSLAEALKAKKGSTVVAVAGGTDILVRLHDRVVEPWPQLLVLDFVKPLHEIKANEKYIGIGPLTTFSGIEKSSLLRKYAPQLVEAAMLAGSTQIRNRATVGGNIVNGSPAGDTIPPLYVLDASLELSSVRGKRLLPIADFFTGPGKTVLRHDELLTSIKIPKTNNSGFFLRLATRRALAISKISVAASLKLYKGKIASIKIALGAVAPTVIRATETESYLTDKPLIAETIEKASTIAKGEARPITDIRSDAEYRQEMVAILLKRGLTGLMGSHAGK